MALKLCLDVKLTKGRLAMTNINSTESKISKKTNLWVYLMRELNEVGRPTLNLGSTIPQAEVLDLIRRK